MSGRTILVGALAMLCGITAAMGTTQLMRPQGTDQPAVVETVKLPVAALNIARGDRITETMITEQSWPKDLAPQGVVTTKEDLVGKIAQAEIFVAEPFQTARVGETERFSGLVAAGMRAYTVLTPNDASLVAGLITPGDRVDVLFTDRQTEKDFTGGGSTTPLLQNIEVMAVGRELSATGSRDKDVKDMRSVTLAVTLDMATKLALAQQLGTLHLALRSEQDTSTAAAAAITLHELMRTMYPALRERDEAEGAAAAVAPGAETTAGDAPGPMQRKELVVRTLRGFAPSEVVMAVSADGRDRLTQMAASAAE